MHRSRLWGRAHEAGMEWLAAELSRDGPTYTPCSSFRVRGTDLYLLNDATGPDGAQEYPVVYATDVEATLGYGWQVESLTCGWMTREGLLACLTELAGIAGVSDALARFKDRCCAHKVAWSIHAPAESCRWCA